MTARGEQSCADQWKYQQFSLGIESQNEVSTLFLMDNQQQSHNTGALETAQ